MSGVELLRTSVHSYILHSSGLLCPIFAQLVPTCNRQRRAEEVGQGQKVIHLAIGD